MQANQETLGTLQQLLQTLLSHDNRIRKEGEAYLATIETQPGFLVVVLQMIHLLSGATTTAECAIRQIASVVFKNAIKRRWEPEDDTEQAISQVDRDTLKTNLIDLMCSTPPEVQKQLAEAVAIIAKYDFPSNWQSLIPHLVSKLASSDILVIKGVMLTANGIFKRFRNVNKSDELYSELVVCLTGFQAPLTQIYCATSGAVAALGGSKDQLCIVFETLRLMTRIFYSLNWQDIPEYFEDNIASWMEEFARYLSYKNPLLVDDREEAGPIESLQTAVIENLNLYASKYEEEFAQNLGRFTQAVWQLLVEVGTEPKYDALATSGIKFLTSVSSKEVNRALFSDDVLRSLIEQIVVRNLMSSETDEELFEDNPLDYIRKDFEGNDQDTRRRCACDLVRALLKLNPTQVTGLCLGYIGAMLQDYQQSLNWRSKDAALHLVLAVSATGISSTMGVGELNPGINIMEVFGTHVLPEIADVDVNARPIVKSDAIKLLCLFRTHLDIGSILAVLPNITRHLTSENVVVQTYAAICIERFLTVKDKMPSGDSISRVKNEHIAGLLNDMFSGLFTVLDNLELPDNDYVMKCIMRLLVLLGPDIGQAATFVLGKLTSALERVCKNPANPQFNHYLFESLAVIVRSLCTGQSPDVLVANATQVEALLFPPFQGVLSLGVEEFLPYVFQVMAEMLYYRPVGPLSDAYRSLFMPILSPTLWENKGNTPALSELLKAYILRGMAEIISGGQLEAVLGIFQKTLASKVTEQSAFAILDNLIANNDLTTISPYIPTILQLLFRRMMENKTPQYSRMFLHTLFHLADKFGGQLLFEACESIQQDMTTLILAKVFEPNIEFVANSGQKKVSRIIAGATKLLCGSNVKLNPSSWAILVRSIIALTAAADDAPVKEAMDFMGDEELAENREFDGTFSKLAYAHIPEFELSPEASQARTFFTASLADLCRASPGQYSGLLSTCLDAQTGAYLQSLLHQSGLALV